MGSPSNSQFSTDPTKSTTFALTTRAAASDARHVIVIDQRRTDLGPTLIQLGDPLLVVSGAGCVSLSRSLQASQTHSCSTAFFSRALLVWMGSVATKPTPTWPSGPGTLSTPANSRERAFIIYNLWLRYSNSDNQNDCFNNKCPPQPTNSEIKAIRNSAALGSRYG